MAKKKTKKKTSKKVPTKKGSENALQAATSLIDQTLKKKDWRVVDFGASKKSLPHIPMGSIVIDYLIGGKPNMHGVPPCPGMPRGRIMQLYGHEGSGKTTLALTCAASTIASGGTVCFIDYENAIVPYYAEALGVPIANAQKWILAQPESLDQGMQIAYAMAKAGVDLLVFDSVGAGVPKKILDQDLDDVAELGQIGLLAAMWSKFLPKIRNVCGRTGTALIGISQIRQNIQTTGHGGSGNTVQGGKAWRFYSDLRLMLRRLHTEKAKTVNPLTNKKEDKVIGAKIIAKLDKCKISSQQGNEETLYIRQGEGFDDYRTIIEIGIAHNLVKKNGAWIEWHSADGEHSHKVQGMDRFRQKMIDEDGAMQALYDQVIPYLGATVTPIEEEVDGEDPEIGGDEDIEELGEMLSAVGSKKSKSKKDEAEDFD